MHKHVLLSGYRQWSLNTIQSGNERIYKFFLPSELHQNKVKSNF